MSSGSSGGFSMLSLLRMEIDSQLALFQENLSRLKSDGVDETSLDAVIRALHSLKGAAKLVNIMAIFDLADALDEYFVSVKNRSIHIPDSALVVIEEVIAKVREYYALDDDSLVAQATAADQACTELVGRINALSCESDKEQAATPVSTDNKSSKLPKVDVAKSNIDSSMLDMFREEAESHGVAISDSLLKLEENSTDDVVLERLMRAAHSIKGAARMVGVDVIVKLAHEMEEVFVAAQNKKLVIADQATDILLTANDTIASISSLSEDDISLWGVNNAVLFNDLLASIHSILTGDISAPATPAAPPVSSGSAGGSEPVAQTEGKESTATSQEQRVLKVTAERWDSMIGLAGEIKVEAGWVVPYLNNMNQLRKKQYEISAIVDSVRDYLGVDCVDKELLEKINSVHHKVSEFRKAIIDQIGDLDQYERRISNLTDKLHREALSTRMRPFSDGVQGFQRMVRDIARSLGKKVKFVVKGENTQVDREVLEKMEAPLNHIIRNALDHGIEDHDERLASGKPEQATIVLSASHSEGMLRISVRDDGRGIDIEKLREKILKKGLVSEEMACELSREELLEFLFLPSFSTRDQVTDLSGRGVGLDVVMDVIQTMRGTVKIESEFGVGSKFVMRLPLTLSVISSLLVEVAGQYYAFPLSRIVRTSMISRDDIEVVEDYQYAEIDGENVALLSANKVLELPFSRRKNDQLPVIIVTDHNHTYGVVVDRFIDQRELAVQRLDSRLGKVQDVSATALLEDGSTVLIVDVDDMVRTIDLLVKGGRVGKVSFDSGIEEIEEQKSVLVVDDSMTVREVERKLLEEAGYHVDIAVDGIDGWNAIRSKSYDLVISDIDMPRMNGIELVRMIKSNKQYSLLPIIIISYKDRQEDRAQGMEAGADYYLTKGSFHDDSLLNAVHDLIGEAVI